MTQQLLQDWYENMDPEVFTALYPADGELFTKGEDAVLPEEQHYNWIKQNKITATPTIFINGYKMPRHYNLNDLKALIPGLAAQIQEQALKKNEKEEIA